MKVNRMMIVLVLFLGVVVGVLILLHCDLNNVRHDLAALHYEVGSVDARLSGFEADMDNIYTAVPWVITSLTADPGAIKTDVSQLTDNVTKIETDVEFIRLNGLP